MWVKKKNFFNFLGNYPLCLLIAFVRNAHSHLPTIPFPQILNEKALNGWGRHCKVLAWLHKKILSDVNILVQHPSKGTGLIHFQAFPLTSPDFWELLHNCSFHKSLAVPEKSGALRSRFGWVLSSLKPALNSGSGPLATWLWQRWSVRTPDLKT